MAQAVDVASTPLHPNRQPRASAQQAILAWYRVQGRDLPWRHTRDPYHVLVAEIMLQQTQVERVLPKYRQWLAAFPTLAALAEAPVAEAIRLWAPLGYNGRAVRLQRMARQCSGRLPRTFEGLLALKGIGPYTAGAIACFAYEQQVAFWDTNVRRVLTRLFRAPDVLLAAKDMEALAAAVLPPGDAYDWHQALMDLGATICTSRNPRCDLCPAMSCCASHPAILFGPGLLRVAERKAPYDAQPFETTDRYFRGRLVDALRERSPRAFGDLPSLLGRDDAAWLEKLVSGLERDGLVVRQAQAVSLP